jgi:ferric-dicitrate binding protein FerR (iron transport regulator)
MKVTRDIINDLIPLYFASECSADTRALVEEYLQQNPQEADEFRRIMATSIPPGARSTRIPDETRAFQEARRRLRRRAVLMGLAIFFSLAPLSISNIDGRVWWCLRDAPGTALSYASIAAVFWSLYAINRKRSRSL